MIHDRGYWVGLNVRNEHAYDSVLSESLLTFTKQEQGSYIDFGCGLGNYVKHLRDNGVNIRGYDGNPETPTLSDGYCEVLDLSQPANVEPVDWVISLEVGEHLPAQYEDIFIDNLHRHNTKGIILSWAVKGQGGHGHFNEQNNDYVKEKICKLGYINDVEQENFFRERCSLGWFRNTIMVFRRI